MSNQISHLKTKLPMNGNMVSGKVKSAHPHINEEQKEKTCCKSKCSSLKSIRNLSIKMDKPQKMPKVAKVSNIL